MQLFYIANIRLPTEKAHGMQIMKMCEAFARAGVVVELVVPARSNEPFEGIDSFQYYGVERNFVIRRLKVIDPIWLMRLPQGVYIKAQALFFIISLFFSGVIPRCGNDRAGDVVLYTRDEYLLPVLLRCGRKVVWEAHTLPAHPRKYINAWIKCAKIVCISRGLKEDLVVHGIPSEKILLAHDGVDIERFYTSDKSDKTDKSDARRKLGLPQDTKIVLYTGHLYEWKGAGVLLEAARSYQSQDLLFVFVGGTEYDVEQFRACAKKLKVTNVLIVGHRPPTEIPLWLKVADVLVIPNSARSPHSAIYTSPMKVFEYMASGVPIVASDVSALREVATGIPSLDELTREALKLLRGTIA